MIFILDKSMNIRDTLSNSGEISHITPFFDDIYTSYLETGAETYQFSTLANTKESQHLIVGNHIAFQYEDEYKLFTITEIEETHDENFIKTVYCEMAGLKLINKIIRPIEFKSTNLRKFLEEILSDTDWNIGALDIGLNNVCDIEIKDYTNAYSLLQTHIRESYKGEIHFTVKFEGSKATKYINVYSNRGQFDGFRFSYDSNLTSITRTINFDDLATALIGVGNNGLTFKEIETEDKPLNQDFITDESAYLLWNDNGSHILGYEKFDTDSPQELLKLTREKLKERCQPKIKYELNPELLGETVKIGDTVYVIDNEFNPPIHLSARINQLSISLTDKSNNSCVLSNFTEITSNITEEMRQIASQLEGYVDGQFPIGGDKIQDGAINGDKLTNGQIIQGTHIFANSITADHIQAETIDTEHLKADSIDAEKIQANSITSNHIQSNTIDSDHIQSNTIDTKHLKSNIIDAGHINANSITSEHIQSNTISSDHIQTGSITAGSGIVADGAIGNAQISKIDAGKIDAGTIDTSKVTIQGSNGHLRLKGNRLQVFQGTGNQAKERVSVGDVNGDGTVYGLRVRGADGQTILLDENGVKSEGITDGAITNDKINEDANIDGAKLNINSVINRINTDGTEVIQGTKIEVDGTNLGVKLSEITNKQTSDGDRITQAQAQITANQNAIKLKVDEQTYTTDKKDMTSKLEKNTSEISTMKGQIALKVEQTDITNAIDNLKIDARNIIKNSADERSIVASGTTNKTGAYCYFVDGITFLENIKGKKMTVAFDWEYIGETPGGTFYPQYNNPNYAGLGSTVTISSNNKKGTYVSTRTINVDKEANGFYIRTDNMTGKLVINKPRMYYGDKDYGWTIAPEDIDTKINTAKAEIKVTTDAITQNVSNLSQTVSNKADGSTVSSLNNKVSSLETSVNGISGKVTSLEKTTTTLGTQVNTANTNASSALNKANSATTTANNAQNTANTNKSNITNLQGEVSTVKSNVASLEVSTSGISQKVSSVESTTATLTNKVNTAQNTANANKTNISSLQTEVSTVKNNVASLDVTTNGISQKVSSLQSTTTTLTNKVNTAQSTADNVNSKIDGLQVGGRNLALKTNQGVIGWDWGLQTGGKTITEVVENGIKCCKMVRNNVASTGWSYICFNQINRNKYLPSKKYTISFDIKSSIVTSFYVGLKEGNSLNPLCSDVKTGNTVANKWTRLSVTITTKDTLPASTSQVLYLGSMNSNVGVSYIFRNLIIVEGNKATDWTPAPEDVDGAINAVDGKVTTLQGTVNTTNSKVATLETNLNGITQRVSSTESTTATLTTKVNNAQNTADNVSSKLNNLQIGTRNLLKDTSSELKSVTFGGWDYYFPNNLTSWKVGGQLTGRVYIKPTNQEASCMLHVRYTDSTYSQYRGNVIKAGTEGYSTVTITVNPPSGKTVSHIQFSIRHSASNTPSDVVYYKEAKVESGNKATDWSPAPEDVASDINRAENKANNALQKKMGINLIVNQGTYAPNQPNKEGELYIHGFDANGNKADVDGYIINPNNGNKITIPKGAINANDKIPYNQEIYLCYSSRLWFAWYNTSDKKWKYLDANANSYQNTINNLTWGDSHLVLGVVVASGAEMYTSGFLYDTPKNYRDAIGNTIEFTTTKSQVSTIETNLSGITSRVGTVETKQTKTDGKVSSLETRMSTAESKITESAITNTVKKNFYTKNDIDSKGYQTSSQVQQTVDKLELKFQQSGGYNFVKNSNFINGTTHWNKWGSPSVLSSVNSTSGYKKSLKITTTGSNSGAYQVIDNLCKGRKYTISGYVHIESGSGGLQVYDGSGYPSKYASTVGWHWISFTFTANATSIQVQLGRGSGGSNGTYYFTAIMLEEGEVKTGWSPHPSEIYDGITTIDKDGITVKQSNISTYTTMDASSFRVENNTGGTVAEFSQNSQIPNLTAGIINANEIYSPNICTKSPMSGSIKYIVNGSTGNDNNNGTYSSPFKTVSKAVSMLNTQQDRSVDIEIYGSVTGFDVKGINGTGAIRFYFSDDAIVNGAVIIGGITNTIGFHGGSSDKPTFKNGISIYRCRDVEISSLTFRGTNSSGNNIYLEDVTFARVYSCDLGGLDTQLLCAIQARRSNLWIYNCRGSKITDVVAQSEFSIAYASRAGTSNVPDYSNAYLCNYDGAGRIHNWSGGNFVKTPSKGWNPAYTPTQKTQTWSFNKIWSDETLHGWSDRQELIQGYSSTWNTGRWTGYMQFTDGMDAIRSAISGGTNLSGRIYVQRTSSSGNSTGSKLCLYASDGTLITNSTSINRSQGVWVSLSSSIIQKIQSGAITYFYLKADSNNTATYFKCERNAKIEITYTK